MKMAATLVLHNVPLAVTDHLGPLLKESFKDSKTAQEYRCVLIVYFVTDYIVYLYSMHAITLLIGSRSV